MRPARNAPSASESPSRDVNHATAKQITPMERMNNSLLPVLAMAVSTRGTRRGATSQITSQIPIALANRSVTSTHGVPVSFPARNGISSIMGMKAMS